MVLVVIQAKGAYTPKRKKCSSGERAKTFVYIIARLTKTQSLECNEKKKKIQEIKRKTREVNPYYR